MKNVFRKDLSQRKAASGQARRAVESAESRVARQANVVVPRAPSLESKWRIGSLWRMLGQKTAFKTDAATYQAKMNLSLARSLRAQATTARGWENIFSVTKAIKPAGKIAQGFWNWRMKKNAVKLGWALEREALMQAALETRERGLIEEQQIKLAKEEGAFEKAALKHESAKSRYVLEAAKGASQAIANLNTTLANMQTIQIMYGRKLQEYRNLGLTPPAGTPAELERGVRTLANTMGTLSERLNREPDPNKQIIIANRISELQTLANNIYEMGQAPAAPITRTERAVSVDAAGNVSIDMQKIVLKKAGGEITVNNAMRLAELLKRVPRYNPV